MSAPEWPVDWIFSMGRYHLMVAGYVVATEGDICRDPDIPGRGWTGEAIKMVAAKAAVEPVSDLVAQARRVAMDAMRSVGDLRGVAVLEAMTPSEPKAPPAYGACGRPGCRSQTMTLDRNHCPDCRAAMDRRAQGEEVPRALLEETE